MAEEGTTAVSLPSSPLHKNASPFSSSFRFLRFADHPNSVPSPDNHYELDEGDVFWSPDLYSDISSDGGDSPTSTLSATGYSSSSPPSCPSDRRCHPFLPEKFGLSAALADDRVPSVQQRRAGINVPVGRAAAAEVSKVFHQSAPVNVPVWPRGRRSPAEALVEEDDREEDEAEEEMLPPHVILARSHVMAFSVFEGVGRTLKGRDLRRVRNAVFQKTGFLD